jgi:hypothetical protein
MKVNVIFKNMVKFVEHESHKTKNVEVNSHAPEVQQCGTRQIIQRNH